MASGPITSWEIDGEMETVADFIFWGSKITADGDYSRENKRCLLLGRKVMTNLDSIFKSRDITNKGSFSQGSGFSSSHVWMWELDYKESWAPKNWCFWTVVLEKTLENPLDSKEIQPVHPKDNQSWVFIGRMLKLKVQYWCKEQTHLKRSWCWERLKAGEGDDRGWDGWMASPTQWTWVWVKRVGDGEGGLVCCSSWGRKESDTTERLNWTELKVMKSCLTQHTIWPFSNKYNWKTNPVKSLYDIEKNVARYPPSYRWWKVILGNGKQLECFTLHIFVIPMSYFCNYVNFEIQTSDFRDFYSF